MVRRSGDVIPGDIAKEDRRKSSRSVLAWNAALMMIAYPFVFQPG